MSDCDKNEVYPSKLAKMSEFRHIFSRATLWVDIAIFFHNVIPSSLTRKGGAFYVFTPDIQLGLSPLPWGPPVPSVSAQLVTKILHKKLLIPID